MNILLVSHELSVTGAPNSLLRQAIYFKSAGHSVDVWTLKKGALEKRYKDEGFLPIYVENKEHEIFWTLKKQNKKYDFVLCNTTVSYKAVQAFQYCNIPLVWFIRETKLVDEAMRQNATFAKVFKEFNNLYTVSEYAANVIKKYNPQVRVIHNAIEDAFVDYSTSKDVVRFGFIGSIHSVKGIDLLIDVYLEFIKIQNNTELYIAGNYNNEFGIMLREKTQHIASVKWLGEIQGEAKEKFFNSIDVLCVPSLDDPCPLVVIEGAMRGKALIATQNTGSNYIIQQEYNGYIVETNSKTALFDAMNKIMNQDLMSMQQNSRTMYEAYGSTNYEKESVLKMLQDSIESFTHLHTIFLFKKRIVYFIKNNIFKKIKKDNMREIYFFTIKVFSYSREK